MYYVVATWVNVHAEVRSSVYGPFTSLSEATDKGISVKMSPGNRTIEVMKFVGRVERIEAPVYKLVFPAREELS